MPTTGETFKEEKKENLLKNQELTHQGKTARDANAAETSLWNLRKIQFM
jgi:hypothetical protein